MRYQAFEQVMSQARMSRYLTSTGGNSRKAMTLYRYNLRLSQELFTVVSCFEIALRNAIDAHYVPILGNDWLRDAATTNGIFDNRGCIETREVIRVSIRSLNHRYTHAKLVASLGFGFWRFMFARHQYRSAGQTLIEILPQIPSSTPQQQHNNIFVFNELKKINDLRNRLAHHEPVCFRSGHSVIDTTYAQNRYQLIKTIFNWMNIDEQALMYGLDKVNFVISRINNI